MKTDTSKLGHHGKVMQLNLIYFVASNIHGASDCHYILTDIIYCIKYTDRRDRNNPDLRINIINLENNNK